jgi:hypothetical protein
VLIWCIHTESLHPETTAEHLQEVRFAVYGLSVLISAFSCMTSLILYYQSSPATPRVSVLKEVCSLRGDWSSLLSYKCLQYNRSLNESTETMLQENKRRENIQPSVYIDTIYSYLPIQWQCGLGRGPWAFVGWIADSNPAWGMDVCPWSLYVVLSCAGRDLATSWSLVQGVLWYVLKCDWETELTRPGPTGAVVPRMMLICSYLFVSLLHYIPFTSVSLLTFLFFVRTRFFRYCFRVCYLISTQFCRWF